MFLATFYHDLLRSSTFFGIKGKTSGEHLCDVPVKLISLGVPGESNGAFILFDSNSHKVSDSENIPVRSHATHIESENTTYIFLIDEYLRTPHCVVLLINLPNVLLINSIRPHDTYNEKLYAQKLAPCEVYSTKTAPCEFTLEKIRLRKPTAQSSGTVNFKVDDKFA